MRNLKEIIYPELRNLLREWGYEPYRYSQILTWIYKKAETNINNFTDLPKKLREILASKFYLDNPKVYGYFLSKDGTVKFIVEFWDNERVETVYIPQDKRHTVCVSVQVGCPLGCKFCATGFLGFKRNLEYWEILDQVLIVQEFLKRELNQGEKITNVVFMGMGEPLLNTENVIKSIVLLNDLSAFGIGARKITVSTVGITDEIYKLAEINIGFKLALSLHSPIQEKREQIIPIAKKYSLIELKKAISYYFIKKRKMVTLEYIHLPGFNDTDEDIKALLKFIGTLKVKVNLIPYNPFPLGSFKVPTREEFLNFVEKLRRLIPHPVTMRIPRGVDIFGACGQLYLHQLGAINRQS